MGGGREGKGWDHNNLRSSLLLTATGALIALVVAEGLGAAILPPPIVWQSPQERYQNHATRLFSLRPNQRAFTHDRPVRINALGFRGADVEMPKPAGRFRIVAMGDSITFGNGVAEEETFSARLEQALRGTRSCDVDVINAGIPAYDTWQQALLLEEVVLGLTPDMVILGFYENDITPRPMEVRPVVNREGESPRSGLGAWLGDRWIGILKQSRVLLLTREAYQRARARFLPSPAATRRMALLRGDSHRDLESGWMEVNRSFDRMRVLLKHASIPFRIVIFPMPEQVWNSAASTAGYQARVKAIAKNIGVPTVDLLPAFREAAADKRSLFIPWDWHPNPAGHQVAAKSVEAFIRPAMRQCPSGHSIT